MNVSGSKYLFKIDFKKAYQQMIIKNSDFKYTIINTHKGLFCNTHWNKILGWRFSKCHGNF